MTHASDSLPVVHRSAMTETQLLPWYRYGWPWFLISIPLISVILCACMLYLALTTNNSLVVGDYYQQGKAINGRIERDRVATLLGVNAVLRESSEGLVLDLAHAAPMSLLPVSVQTEARILEDAFVWSGALSARWVHVTQAERDISMRLVAIGGNRYLAAGDTLPTSGYYRLHLEPERLDPERLDPERLVAWRLVSPVVAPESDKDIRIAALPPQQVFADNLFKP